MEFYIVLSRYCNFFGESIEKLSLRQERLLFSGVKNHHYINAKVILRSNIIIMHACSLICNNAHNDLMHPDTLVQTVWYCLLYHPPLTCYMCCSDSWLTVFWASVTVFTSFSMRPSPLPPNHQLVLTRPPVKKRQSRPGETVRRNPLQACSAVQTCAEPAASKT